MLIADILVFKPSAQTPVSYF